MSRVSKTTVFTLVLLIALVLSAHAQSTDCSAGFDLNFISYIERDGTQLVSVPVIGSFDCAVGAIQIDFTTDPWGALEPVGIDTTGSMISYWERLETNRHRLNEKMSFFGLANYPDGQNTPPLQPQTGLLFNLLLRFGCEYLENVLVNVVMDSVVVSDSSGYIIFQNVHTGNSTVYVGEENTPVPRGDVTCDGMVIGGDVTWLVNYFRGLSDCACSRCAGDANNDGSIIGGDVTYLVNYFRGLTPSLEPCE